MRGDDSLTAAPEAHPERIAKGQRSRMRGWDFDTATLQKALRGEIIPNPSIDLGNPCNLNCPYCFVEEKLSRRKVRRPHELSIEETRAVIEDFHAAGAATVNIVGAGEPTIDSHFEELITLIGSLGMVPVVFTNGIRIARETALARFLYCHDATVVLKFNSRDPVLQDLVAGRPGYTSLRDQALEVLLDTGFASYTPTRLSVDTLAFRGNLAELPSIYRWCLERNIHPLVSEYIPTGRTEGGRFVGEASLPPNPAARRAASEALEPLTQTDRVWLSAQMGGIHRELGLDTGGPCAYHGGEVCTQLLGVYVDISGNIWPCVARTALQDGALVPGRLGNIRDGDHPSKVWRSHVYMAALRARFDGSCPYKPAIPGVADGQAGEGEHAGSAHL